MGQRHWPSTSPPEIDPNPSARLSRAEATAAFDAFIAAQPERLARFHELVARLGGPRWGCDTESMRGFGSWMIDVMAWGDPGSEPPSWVERWSLASQLSADSVWLAELAGTPFLACLREAVPGLEWQLCVDRRDSYYHQPLLEPAHIQAGPMSRAITEALAETPNREWLAEAWLRVERRAREALLHPPTELDDDALPLDEIGVDPYDHDRFNAQIWIPEGAEVALGEERFLQLADRFAGLKGVQEVVQEDREVFLVRVDPDVDLDALRARVIGVVRRMKAAAENDDD